jgi:valyl-tRNA synthetase
MRNSKGAMKTEIPKVYDSGKIESRWYQLWENRGYFSASTESERPPFVIVMPPPNVTGSLHMGHALNHTVQDVIVRHKRMRGFNTLWLPGTDHAGIATQNVVERQLREEGLSRHDLGRERFVERVWEWKKRYGDLITEQIRRIGDSCDWPRERFTLDERLSQAVREVFVRLYDEGLIYRGERLINWCPRCRTALSDLEVEYEPVQGSLYHIRYPIEDAEEEFVEVATTRPETMLGDTGVAVHPEDARYTYLRDRAVRLPLIGRRLPVIQDAVVDRDFGTGVVKVTPAHDPADFDMGERHGLKRIGVIDEDGRITAQGGAYKGLDRFEARERILVDLKQQQLLTRVDSHLHNVGHCSRCKTIVEPLLSTQWFVDVQPMAKEAIRAVEEGRTRFVPANWAKTYFEWMHNIRDWCISRQLWWGHRIPAWYCQCGEIIVSTTDPVACSKCGSTDISQDEDVLDTWFSSQLWPFSTMGWPEQTADFKAFYPTSLLVTGFDIIFFWVARMIMAGLKFAGDVPFKEVYITGLVRDIERQKLSKSKGNAGDPMLVCEQYGTDAVRFTLARLGAPGSDLVLTEDQLEGYRAFSTKIWNAARFILSSEGEADSLLSEDEIRDRGIATLSLADQWILSRQMRAVEAVNRALDRYFLHEAARSMYQFFWHEFCDWYLEMVKLHQEESRPILIHVFEKALRMLHPVMPFITEELWQRLPHNGESIVIAPYPVHREDFVNDDVERDAALIQDIIIKVRNIRAEVNVDTKRWVSLRVATQDAAVQEMLNAHEAYMRRLARVDRLEVVSMLKGGRGAAQSVAGGLPLEVPLADVIDFEAEQARLGRELEKVHREIDSLERKLSNPDFVEKAPGTVVEENRRRLAEYQVKKVGLAEGLERLR